MNPGNHSVGNGIRFFSLLLEVCLFRFIAQHAWTVHTCFNCIYVIQCYYLLYTNHYNILFCYSFFYMIKNLIKGECHVVFLLMSFDTKHALNFYDIFRNTFISYTTPVMTDYVKWVTKVFSYSLVPV